MTEAVGAGVLVLADAGSGVQPCRLAVPDQNTPAGDLDVLPVGAQLPPGWRWADWGDLDELDNRDDPKEHV